MATYLPPEGGSILANFWMIIGLSGQSHSGKDTVANILCEKYNFRYRLAFADVLKRFAHEVYHFPIDSLWGPSEFRNLPDPKTGLIPRDILTGLGDWGRLINKDTWANQTMDIAKELIENEFANYYPTKGIYYHVSDKTHKNIIITDGRYINEFRGIKKAGGKLIRVIRPNDKTPLDGDAAKHSSETEQLEVPDNEFDYIIYNEGTYAELEKAVEKCMATLKSITLG